MRGLLLYLVLAAPFVRADLVRYLSGNQDDVRPRLHGPVLMLAGGGGDNTAAMQAAIDRVRGCSACSVKVDVVVLRASGGEGYNPYFMAMDGVDSVVSQVITDRASASRPEVIKSVRDAEVVFFAGGDQCNYIRYVKGTPIEDAVKQVYRRGGAIGGTSAGLAIQSDIVYDACPSQSAKSAEVLVDPFHVDVSLSRDFFRWRHMEATIADTHFMQRDRLGRLLVFLARGLVTYRLREIYGLGVNDGTAVVLLPDGRGQVFGKGPVHLIRARAGADDLVKGAPLTKRDFRIWRYESGEWIDLRHRPSEGGKAIDVIGGKLSADPY